MFKDLQKLVSRSQQEQTSSNEFEKLQDKPFWIWNVDAGTVLQRVRYDKIIFYSPDYKIIKLTISIIIKRENGTSD